MDISKSIMEKKYLAFNYTDENNKVLKKYTELWDGIKNEIELINGGGCNSVEKGEYGKDLWKFNLIQMIICH